MLTSLFLFIIIELLEENIMGHKIIAVVGMCGSGKSVAVEEFVKRGWQRIYVGEATFIKMKEIGLEINPENEIKMQKMLRASGDKGIYARIFLPEIEKKHKQGNIVIESMYSWSEYKIVKEKFSDDFEVLCIATDAPLRRERLANRGVRPLSSKESLTRDVFEIENIEKGGPIGIADHYITNNASARKFKNEVIKYIESFK